MTTQHDYDAKCLYKIIRRSFKLINTDENNNMMELKSKTILEKIKADQLQARKDKDKLKASLLTTLIGEAAMVGKNKGNRDSTDVEVVAVIKKFINNANETITILTPEKQNLAAYATTLAEIRILNEYLPQQLTADGLTEVINYIITEINASTIKDMGKVMKILKERYDGQYDGALASSLIKQKLGN